MTIPDENIILEGSLRRCKKYKLFKTKWVEHYFVLYCRDSSRNLYTIDEFKSSKKTELKKRFNLEYVIRVESNLSISDPSILCTAGHHRPDQTLHCIFGIGFHFQNVLKDLYLVAQSNEEMALWVNELCKLCKLHRQTDSHLQEGDNSHADSSISGMSMSSQSLDMSIIEQQQYSENPEESTYESTVFDESEDRMGLFNFGGFRNRPASSRAQSSSLRKKSSAEHSRENKEFSSLPNTPSEDTQNIFIQNDLIYAANQQPSQPIQMIPDPKQYHRMHQFKSVNSQQKTSSDPNYNNLPDTRSETSSMYSSRRTEDDSVSYTSGPPIPPPRTRHSQHRFIKNGQISRLHMIPASTSMGQVMKGEDAEDSSGETLKVPNTEQYPESVASSEGIPIYERNGRTLIRRAPPPVDRSNKPKNLRSDEEPTKQRRYYSLSRNGGSENVNYSATFTKTSSNYPQADKSKRKNLDYFEPDQVIENSSSSTVAATSTRSPTPSDIEYIIVDVDRTLAFKQMRRSAPSTD